MSNRLMKLRSKFRLALFRFVAIVFFLNTMNAYGACCFTLDKASSAGIETSEAVQIAAADVGLPCHQSSQQSSSAEVNPDCCMMCVPMMSSSAELKIAVVIFSELAGPPIIPSISCGIEQPFRPPIALLS
jgi:hypothetical protein